MRARRSGPHAEWNALALAMLLWGAGMAACMYQEEFRANSEGTPALGMLLFLPYGVPLIHLLAGQEHDVRGARLVDGLLAVALGARCTPSRPPAGPGPTPTAWSACA
ncbi:hypothetical protein [Thermomonas brevis]